MTDLKALRREIAERVGYALRGDDYDQLQLEALVESALLQYAEACMWEQATSKMHATGYYHARIYDGGLDNPAEVWHAMASQRLKEIG